MVTIAFAAGISLSTFDGPAGSYIGIGGVTAAAVLRFLDFYAGVFSLVALSLTVMGGLLATDRVVLLARHRVLLYALHRALAATAMIFLVIHVLTQIVEQRVGPVDVVMPFLASGRTTYIGLGTIASYLMTAVAWTGIIRWRFAGLSYPWLWRVLHSAAYLAWPIALLHGLRAGRPAPTWVTLSYLLCLVLVALALAVRVVMICGRRKRAPRATTSGTIRPVGRLAAESSTAARRRASRRRPTDDVWSPARPAQPNGSQADAGWPGGSQVDVAWPGGSQVDLAWPGGPQVDAGWPGGPQVDVAWPGGPQVDVAWPGGQQVDVVQSGGSHAWEGPSRGSERWSGDDTQDTDVRQFRRRLTTADYWGQGTFSRDDFSRDEFSQDAFGRDAFGRDEYGRDEFRRDASGDGQYDEDPSQAPELVDLAASLRATRESLAERATRPRDRRLRREAY